MKIHFERESCIGCGSCASVCSNFFELKEDGKAFLKDSIPDGNGNFDLNIDEPQCIEEAAEACPVQIIHLIKE